MKSRIGGRIVRDSLHSLPLAGSQPSNACIRWLRGEKCKKVDPSIPFDCLRYDHLDRDFGKYPNAVYPTSANKGKGKKI